MSMLDSFFNKGFKAAKCKTLLKLTIPRIKLLRNRREIQLKHMRRDIAKLLETGQEATARIRVEHIIREEKMMAAQEILELFCELISVRLPIIEAQRECPLDLREAISSVCFAAPRCADLPELLQVQMLFASKYGKEFVSAATELMPDCGVNRQLIELLSVRAPSPEAKLKLLKEIAEEHELDWDPDASEWELFKPHEDLLNGPTQFVGGSKMPRSEEKHHETEQSVPDQVSREQADSDSGLDMLDLPEVPKVSLQPTESDVSAPEMPSSMQPQSGDESSKRPGGSENPLQMQHLAPKIVMSENAVEKDEVPDISVGAREDKQFVPFISPPSVSSVSFPVLPDNPPSLSRTKNEPNVDLQDVLAAAQAAAETAERAAAAARTAASLAQVRISELTKKQNDQVFETGSENPFHTDIPEQSSSSEKPHLQLHDPSVSSHDSSMSKDSHEEDDDDQRASEILDLPSLEKLRVDGDSQHFDDNPPDHGSCLRQFQRLSSMDDETYFSYPNLFTSQKSNLGSASHSFGDSNRSTHDL